MSKTYTPELTPEVLDRLEDYADVEALRARKAELVDLVIWEITKTDGPVRVAAPDPFAHLRGPRRTAWGTLAWSDPDAPALELFGPT